MRQQPKRKKNILALTAIYALTAAFTSYAALSAVNQSFRPDTGHSGAITASVDPIASAMPVNSAVDSAPMNPGKPAAIQATMPKGASDVSFSFDGQYMAYLSGGQLYVMNLSDSSPKAVSGADQVMQYRMMSNQHIIIYFTVTGSQLSVKTYNIESGVQTVQKSFTVPLGTTIRGADYSTNTNMIMIDASRGNGAGSTVYSLNIMKRLKSRSTAKTVGSLVLLNNSAGYYCVDANHRLYFNLAPVSALANQTVKLLGSDASDSVYVQSLTDKKNVYMLRNNALSATIKLDNPDFSAVYASKSGVYLIYPDHIVDLTGTGVKDVPYDRQLTFLAVGGSTAYFVNGKGAIVAQSMT